MYAQNFMERTFVVSAQTMKFVKVFSLLGCFPLYGIEAPVLESWSHTLSSCMSHIIVYICALLSTGACLHLRRTRGFCVTALRQIPVNVVCTCTCRYCISSDVDSSHRGTSLPLWSTPQGNQLPRARDGGSRLHTEQVLSRFPPCKFQHGQRGEEERKRRDERERECVYVCTVFMLIKHQKKFAF